MAFDAEITLKAAGKVKNKQLYSEIANIDLIPKEFKVHTHCYKRFTKGFTASSSAMENSAENTNRNESTYDAGDFDKVT